MLLIKLKYINVKKEIRKMCYHFPYLLFFIKYNNRSYLRYISSTYVSGVASSTTPDSGSNIFLFLNLS